MNKIKIIISIICIFLIFSSMAGQDKFPDLKGPYLGQPPPGNKAVLFAPGLLSSEETSPLGMTVTPDGQQIYYTLFKGPGQGTIMCTSLQNGKWIKPQIAPFSGNYSDFDINLAPDGNTLYFTSIRPKSSENSSERNADIWYVKKDPAGIWGEPVNPGSPLNSDKPQAHPAISSEGAVYFFSAEKGVLPDIYVSRIVKGKYTVPEKLGENINSEFNDADPFIAPDESYIIFQSKRPGGYGKNDLYISFRNDDGTWCKSVNMGPRINTEASDYCGRVTHDGKYLIFSRSIGDSWKSQFYWIDATIIEELKSKALQ